MTIVVPDWLVYVFIWFALLFMVLDLIEIRLRAGLLREEKRHNALVAKLKEDREKILRSLSETE